MEDRLIITIDYEIAPRADDIGELFAALARDYKDFTKGRVLVVTSIEHGSIIATLTDWALQTVPYAKDAVEFARGAKALADFGKIVREWIEGAKTSKKKLPQRRSRKAPGQRSVEAIVKIAADTDRAVRVRHTTPKGETFEVEMSGSQAVMLRDEVLLHQTKVAEFSDVPRIAGAQAALPDLKHAIGRLYQPGIDLSSGSAEAIIDALVEVLQAANLTYLIPQIAADLSNRGMHALASALEVRARRSDGKHEPPLTTT
jgi:hypothetical protein